MEFDNTLIAFGLTLFAGLATGIGSVLAFFAKRTNTRMLSTALGFSAGVMLYVSFVAIFPRSRELLTEALGARLGYWATAGSFFGGVLITALIDRLVPSFQNPHEIHRVEEIHNRPKQDYSRLLRTGFFTAIAISMHNFPEGLATFIGALKDLSIGLPLAIAVAIHNIPEGIAVSVPIYYSTGSRKKAFVYSFLSGLAEPVGAAIGYFLLFSIFSDTVFGIVFAAVAGIMVYISLDELLPSAEEYGEHHYSIMGLIAGMIIMAVSLLIFV